MVNPIALDHIAIPMGAVLGIVAMNPATPKCALRRSNPNL